MKKLLDTADNFLPTLVKIKQEILKQSHIRTRTWEVGYNQIGL